MVEKFMSTAGSERGCQLHGRDEVEGGWFEPQARTQPCSMVEREMSTTGSEQGRQLHGRVEVGGGAWECLSTYIL